MRIATCLLVACAAVATAGCDNSSMGGDSFAPHHSFQATCNTALSGVCSAYESGYSTATLDSERSMCSTGYWSTTEPCPAAGRVGRCTQTQGGLTWENDYYPGFGSTPTDLEVACVNLGGRWAAN
jgi:hypothetical protein